MNLKERSPEMTPSTPKNIEKVNCVLTEAELREIEKSTDAACPPVMEEDPQDGDFCYACSSPVSVRDGCDFEWGDLCDSCAQDSVPIVRADIPKLPASHRALSERLEIAEQCFEWIKSSEIHSASCGDKNNPFNRKDFVDGCNCGANHGAIPRLAREALTKIRGETP